MQAFVLYVSFLGAAWFRDGAFLQEQWGLVRLAVPAGMALLGLTIEDVYAKPGQRSPLKSIRGPVFAFGLAFLSQGVLWASDPDLAVPRWIMFYGCAMSLLLVSAVRMLFPPGTEQLKGANAPAFWPKQTHGPGIREGLSRVADRSPIRKPRLGVTLLLVGLVVAYRLWKRGL